MKYSNTVEYNISTKLDSSGLTKLQSQIKQVELTMQQMANKELLNPTKVENARSQLEGLSSALSKSFDSSLGMLNLEQFRNELQQSKVSAEGLKSAFSMTGSQGAEAFANLAKQIGHFNEGIERSSSTLDKMFTTFSNTFRWGLVSSFFSQFMNAIHSSVDYVKELDDSLTQIMLVTDYNRDSMNEFAKSANEAAKAVSMTTTGMTNASLIFAQQGYDLGQSQELATLSAKVANASQQDTATTSDQITAYMNAYGLENSIGELTQAMDNWALIANISAADVGELAQASQRAASMANAVGVSGEQLASQIATIESVTREAPEQIGNGLKTLYARFSDIASGKEDEDGFTLGKVTSELNKIGVQVLDEMGQIRDVGDIMEDLMVIWDDLDQTSKVAASQALAGKYQVNRFMALMDNSDMYEEYKGATGANAAGTLDMMNEEYAQSIEGRSAKLQASLEGLFSTIFNTDDIYPWMDAAQGAVDLLQQFFDALGGGKTVLLGISSLLGQVFNQNIARSINDAISNQQVAQTRKSNIQNVEGALLDAGINDIEIGQYIQAGADRVQYWNGEQYQQYADQLDKIAEATINAAKANEQLEDTYLAVGAAAGQAFGDNNLLFKDDEGNVNYSNLITELSQFKNDKELMDYLSKIDFSNGAKSAEEFAQKLGVLDISLERVSKNEQELDNTRGILDSVDMALDDLYNSGALVADEYDYLKGILQDVNNELEIDGQASKETAEKVEQLTTKAARLAEAFKNVDGKTLAKGADNIDIATRSQINANQIKEQRTKEGNDLIDNTDRQQQVKQILDAINAVQQLTFAWQTFQNLGSIWSNANLSEGEKFVQTIMALGTALPSVITATQSLQKVMDILIAKDKAYIAQKIASSTQTEAAAVQEARAAVAKAQATVQSAQANVTEAKTALAAADANVAQAKAVLEVAKAEALKHANYDTYSKVIAAEQGLKEAQIARAQAVKSLASAQIELKTAQTGLVTAVQVLNGAMTAYSIATGIAEGATEGFSAALTFLEKHPVIVALTAIAMAATTIFGIIKAQAEEAKQEAQTAFDEAKSNLEQIKALKDKTSAFGEKYEAFKDSGEGGKELIEEAESIAQAMKEAGAEEEANRIHLAALRAEATGTADDFNVLANAIENSQESMTKGANDEAIIAAKKRLEVEDVSIESVLRHQSMIKKAQEELNNLDPLDAGYEAEKERLEQLIATLKDAKLAEEELVDAANTAVEAGINSGMQEMAKTEGQQMQVYGKGDATGAGPPALAAGVMDWSSMQEYLSQTVEGFGSLDELDQLALAAQNVATEAQAAEIQVRQLLLANESLDESTTQHYSRTGDYTLYGREGIQDVMQNEGFDSEQQVKILASLDENASEQEIMAKIQEIKAKMETTDDFDLALKASLDPEQAEQMLQDQINNYQPTDEDIDADQFKSMANYIHGADDSAFEEGGMFEDLSSDIRNNADALEDFVESILRYEDAISTLEEKEEDWRDALADGADLADRVEAVDELRETYSDFLDLSDDVSDSFAENTDNLDLMAAAAEGDVDAYNELLAAASEDIAINVYGIDESSAALQGMSDYLQSDAFNDVEVGMSINDDAFYDNLNAMIAQGNWSREQIEAYLNDIGCSLDPSGIVEGATEVANVATQKGHEAAAGLTLTSEVDSMTAQEEDTNEATSLDVQQIPGGTWTANVPTVTVQTAGMPAATSVPISGEAPPSFKVTAKPVKVKDTKEMSASSVKTEQGGSGTTTVKPGSVKKTGSGGSKSSHSSAPSSGGSGGGGGSCFVAGTLISTSFGYKPIELIKFNDLVLSYNELLRQNEYSKVLQTMIHNTIEPIYTLYIKNEQLRVTGIHRFLISKDISFEPQWIAAQDLQIGDWVLLADNTWHLIWKIEVNLEHQIVYNFEVAGNHNYYVGRNQILAHNKGGGGKKGGGSGSGTKAKTIEQKEKKEHKKDYYEEVNNQLEKTDKILSKIQKEQDRLMGDKAIANQNKQIKLLQKEIALNKDKLDIQKQELADVNALIKKNDERAEQAAKAQGIAASVPEIQLDEDGIVSNYEQISAKIDEIHNQLIDKYNAAAERSDEELTKEIAKSIEKFDEYGENLLKDIQRHNKLQSEIEETNNTLEELDDTIEDIRIDAYKAYQEAQDNFKELKENAAEMAAIFQDFNEEGFLTKWSLDDTPIGDMTKAMYELDNIYNVSKEDANDFYDSIIAQKEKEKQKATDPDEKAAIQSSIDFFEGQKANLTSDTLMNGVVGRAIHDVQQLQGWIDGTNTEPNPFGENTAALRETYEEAYKRATDTYKDWRETVQDLRDAVIDAYDEQEDALERNLDEYDRIIDHLERINDTYTLYYGEDSYDGVLQIMDRQGATMQQHLNDLTDAFIYWQKKYQEALENGDEKLIQSIREKMEDAEDAMYDKAEEIAEHWVERYEKAVDASIQKIDIKLWGSGPGQMDLEDQSTIWELQKDYMDTYKDDVEKAYEVDKLRSKYINLLNDAQGMSLQTQNKIRAQMQEQLALLDGQKTVSEYDVKLANAKLEILQKQIALEDAQRNKNKMQLRRDTQGNYRYVYTADQGDVQQAQDELNESQFDAYEMTKEQTIANNDRAINLYQDYMNKMRDIANKYKDDEVARNAAMKALSEEYGKLLEALEEDFKDTTNGMYEVLMWMIDKGTQDTSTAAMDMLDQLYDKNGEVKENTGNAWRDLATQITKDVLPNINEAVAQGFADINAQASTLKEQMTGDNGVLTKIGSSTDTLKDSIDKAKEATTQWAIETENLFNAFSADNPKVQEAMKQLQAMEAQLKANEQATSALATKYREANDLLTAKTAEAANYKRALENPNEYEYKDGKVVKKEPPKTSNNGGNNSGAKSFSNGSIVGFRGSYSENSWGEGRWGNMYSGRANAVRISSFSRRSGYGPRNVHLETLGGGHLGWVTQSQLFDTGGYTGKWNSNEGMPNSKNGKLAVLHQKELVLNERDTENILTAVSMIRQISTSMQGALSNISAAASNNVSSNYNPITEQRVEIQASFPNATDADDIRQALIGLSDRAYQYAHRVI